MILYPLATVTRVAQARLLHPNLLLQNLQFPAKSSLVSGVTQRVGLQRGFTYAHKQSWQHQGEFTYYVPEGTCLLLYPPIRFLPPACFQQSISLHLDTIAIATEYCYPAANVLDRRRPPSLQTQSPCAHCPPNRSEKKKKPLIPFWVYYIDSKGVLPNIPMSYTVFNQTSSLFQFHWGEGRISS